jgi:hypothetical protein
LNGSDIARLQVRERHVRGVIPFSGKEMRGRTCAERAKFAHEMRLIGIERSGHLTEGRTAFTTSRAGMPSNAAVRGACSRMPNVQTSGGYPVSIAASRSPTTVLAGWLPLNAGPAV